MNADAPHRLGSRTESLLELAIYFIRATVARAYVRVIGAQRELSWILGDTLMPFLSVAAYVLVYQSMGAPEEYTGFVILGGVLVTFWMHMIWSMGMQLFWEKEMGNLERYLMTPMPRAALMLGMALGGIIMVASRAIMIYVAARLLFKIEFHVTEPWLSAAVFFATMGALYGMGMMLSSLFFMAGRGVFYALGIMSEPMFFLGGFYFPVKYLGVFAIAGAALIPTTLGLDALRQTMLGVYESGFMKPLTELWILIGMTVVLTTISVYAVEKLESLGRTQGRLTLRNQ
jgi:ABC-2 type transport system permease protein